MDRDTYIMKKRLQEFKEDLKSLSKGSTTYQNGGLYELRY